jgi:hypothetical protein
VAETSTPTIVVTPRNAEAAYTDTKDNQIFLILYIRKFRMGSSAKSYMRKGFLTHEEMRKYLVIYEEAVSHI